MIYLFALFLIADLFRLDQLYGQECKTGKPDCVETIEVVKPTDKVPDHLKGSKVILVGPDGKQSEPLSREKFRVVPRDKKVIHRVKCECPEPPLPPPPEEKIVEKIVEKPVYKLNLVNFYVGRGRNLLEADFNEHDAIITRREEWIFGVSYTRMIDDTWGLSALAVSTRSYFGGLGAAW